MSTPATPADRPAGKAAAGKAAPRPHRRPKKDPARMVAFQALRAVDERDAYANLILPSLLRKAERQEGFERRDAAFATELVYGTLRLRGSYDAIIAACIHRPLTHPDPPGVDAPPRWPHPSVGQQRPHTGLVHALQVAIAPAKTNTNSNTNMIGCSVKLISRSGARGIRRRLRIASTIVSEIA